MDSMRVELDNLSIALIRATGALGSLRLLVLSEEQQRRAAGKRAEGVMPGYLEAVEKADDQRRRDQATLARIRRLIGPGNCSTDWYQTDTLAAIDVALEEPSRTKCACCDREGCEVWGAV